MRHMQAPATVVFDLDGTLVDTSRDMIAAANRCLEGLGLPARLDAGTDAAVAFRGGRAMLRLGYERAGRDWAEALWDDHYRRFVEIYRDDICRDSRIYPGAVEAVTALRGSGYATAICTNKPAALSELLLNRLGLWRLFDGHVGADTLPVRKPDPAPLVEAVRRAGGDPARALLVGDTDTDRNTARAAGMPSVLVTFGPGGSGMAALAPDALLDDYADLAGLVARLIG
jgi:phosphoglycolate phosphatase